MLEHFTASLPEQFAPYQPVPSLSQRDSWQRLPPATAKALLTRGEQYLHYAWPPLYATHWLSYIRTGDRQAFEKNYFDRRRALCALVLAECVQQQGRFLDDILNGIFAITEESAWQLPAHNSYVRNTPSLPLPDPTRPVLDLFSCETGATLAAVLYLAGDMLDDVSPLVTLRIRTLLEQRILRPYIEDWFWWMGGHGESTCNWTVWCTQNVLLTAFLAPNSQAIRHAAACKAIGSLDAFLADYGEDGCCDEGAQYYRHAGLCLNGALEILDSVTEGLFAPVWQTPKVRNIAHYICHVHVVGAYYINFADCSPKAGRAGVREFLFGKRCGDKVLCDFAAADWRQAGDSPEESNLFYGVQAAFMARALLDYTPSALPLQNVFYQSVGLFIARNETYCLAVKAGDNDDSHNHNDTGSVTLYKQGRPFLIDVGVESYTAKTFSPKRYEIWTMQSSWHNLPDFDGVMQQAGSQYRARDVHVSFGQEKNSIAMELSAAWPKESGLTGYVRKVSMLNESAGASAQHQIMIEDACEGTFGQGTLHLMFCERPVLSGGNITLPDLGQIAVTGGQAMTVEIVPVSDIRLRTAWPDTLYRVCIPFDRNITLTVF